MHDRCFSKRRSKETRNGVKESLTERDVASMKWNVIYNDINSKKMSVFNIFDHSGFYKDVLKAMERHTDNKESFAADVKSSLMYYFWSKYEWEILISPWPEMERETAKVDVYWQVMNNWEQFIDYVWDYRALGGAYERKKNAS